MEKERSQASPQEYLLNSETSPEMPQVLKKNSNN